MIEALLSVRFAELVDLAVVWAMVWAGIVWLRAAPARLALAGLGILVAIYLLARQLGLVLTTWILQGFAGVTCTSLAPRRSRFAWMEFWSSWDAGASR